MKDRLVIGSRGSDLALWQSEFVAARLRESNPGLEVAIEIIATEGDKVVDRPLAEIGGKGLFTRELEDSLLDGRIDIAVHSLKDLPTADPVGLDLVAVSKREDPADAFIALSPEIGALEDLPAGAVVATGSLRRRSQLLAMRPDLEVVDIRGNVPTRLKKQREQGWDGMILAAAGLIRLNLQDRIAFRFDPARFLPAVGQGVLGLQGRSNDDEVRELVAPVHSPAVADVITAERSFLRRLEGGCQAPIAAHATVTGGLLTLEGYVGSPDGSVVVREARTAPPEEREEVGVALAEQLLRKGAGAILAALDGRE